MSLPIELYREIFKQSDFVTTLRFRGTCKAFSAFHTAATREHSQISSTIEAVVQSKIVLLKAMTESKVPQFIPHIQLVTRVSAIGLNDLPFFKMLVEEYGLRSAKDYKDHLDTAQTFNATAIVNYIQNNRLHISVSYSESDYSSSESDSYWEVHSDFDACGTPEYCSDGIWSDTE